MCDTLGNVGRDRSFFAKNSDRSPNEVQILEYHRAKKGLSGMVSCTYLAIPQAEETYAVLLSRPDWMWGAEMGVNEFGLCIGTAPPGHKLPCVVRHFVNVNHDTATATGKLSMVDVFVSVFVNTLYTGEKCHFPKSLELGS